MKLVILTINSDLLPSQTKANRRKESTGPNSINCIPDFYFIIELKQLEFMVQRFLPYKIVAEPGQKATYLRFSEQLAMKEWVSEFFSVKSRIDFHFF